MTARITTSPIAKPVLCVCGHSDKEHSLVTSRCLHITNKGIMDCQCEKYEEKKD